MRKIQSSWWVALLVAPASAAAQEFNLDVGDATTFGIPSSAYGAAAGQAGEWFSLNGGPPYAFTLDDVHGTTTSVVTDCQVMGNGLGDYSSDNALTSGDDELLMDDLQDVGGVGSTAIWTFSGLAPGAYNVFTYAWAPDVATYTTNITPGGTSDTQVSGGPWPGGHALGTTYALHCVTVDSAGVLVLEIATATGFGSVNGFQLVPKSTACGGGAPGVAFCFCDGGGTAAPCGNTGAAGNGCANGSVSAGANLTATGAPVPDGLVLEAVGLVPGQPGLYFQGDNEINGGLGVTFGDGLRCAGGGVVRLQVVAATTAGTSATTVDLFVTGGITPGDTRSYQLWYRDPASSPCGTGFNLTNGVTVDW
ncbi:MAG: hypothetical protein QF903_03125 [Planctomycetota bacterium]|jgi:hypothetical protein|nr:hypothetical protein [Planctomycetota bacterium]MDP6763601.1 hypothetical protein [Planctomycetota bacterium]MDP6988450.1 hypothetical protein [Planctomycetota bacterium]